MNDGRIERGTVSGSHTEGQLPGDLAATMAHELRNPLASILLDLHVIRHGGVDEAVAREAYARAERQARHMARIIETVLEISRGEHGKLRLRTQRVALAAVVDDAVEIARPALAGRGHRLTVSLPPEPVSLVADASRLVQVLTNLLTNAARYTDPGGEIGLVVEAADGVAVLRVRDNGEGIAPDLLPRIFDLFRQGDRPEHREGGGLGIGLALVKVLVELHGGSIAAYSRGPGTGSEFVVRLPGCPPNGDDEYVPGGLATVFSAGAMLGPWLRTSGGRGWQVLLAAAAVALVVSFQLLWLSRARSARIL